MAVGQQAADGIASAGVGLIESITGEALVQKPREDWEQPTPEDLWFTARQGWPAPLLEPQPAFNAVEGQRSAPPNQVLPKLLMPTAETAACLYDGADTPIGELRLEVLEAERLPKSAQLLLS